MRWLVGNVYYFGAQDCSIESIGRAVGALYDAIIKINASRSLFFKEDFRKSAFSEIEDVPDLLSTWSGCIRGRRCHQSVLMAPKYYHVTF